VRKHLDSSITILAFRILLLAAAAAALVTGLVVTRRADRPGVEARVFYLCPMHPEVTSSSPGDCPICRMQLQSKALAARTGSVPPTEASAGDDRSPATFTLPPGAEIRSFEELGYGKMYEMSREMRAPAWADTSQVGQALLYRDEIAMLGPDEEARFYPSTRLTDGQPAGIKVTRIDEPPTPWDSSTALVRFRVDARAKLTPDQTGWVKFSTRVRQVRAVRASALVQSPDGPYVFLVAKDKRTFTKRPIQIGSVLYGHAAVLSGLGVGERVATLNTFSLDAERRFSGRSAP